MTNIEPTEEQKQAANSICNTPCEEAQTWVADAGDIARLLAEREAKLRERHDASVAYYKAQADAYHLDVKTLHMHLDTARARERTFKADLDNALGINDTLRARVAELESEVRIAWADCADGSCEACAKCVDQAKHQRDFATARVEELEASNAHLRKLLAEERGNVGAHSAQHLARIAELEGQVSESTRLRMTETLHGMGVEAMYQEREAQHLADIRASLNLLKESRQFLWLMNTSGPLVELRAIVNEHIARLAHYDDAKADAPAVDWQAWANGSCPEPGCSLANPHEQGVACVKPTAEGGEG